ncbi:ig-like domain-containing protein, partial [Trichonephila inaurata madagascariensis]
VEDESLIHYPPLLHHDGEETSRVPLQPKPGTNGERVSARPLSRVINVRSDERTVGGNHRNSGLQVAENYGKVSERNRSSSSLSARFVLEITLLFTIIFFL